MFTLNSADFNLGTHTLEVKVEDPTSRVRNDPAQVLIDSHSWEIIISESILAPLGCSGTKVVNRSLSQAEYINVLTWQKNPAKKRIVKYRIYQLIGNNRQLISEIELGVFEFRHRNVEKTKVYNYCIVAVNDLNIEGIPAYITIQ
jgi:hypothetical protein